MSLFLLENPRCSRGFTGPKRKKCPSVYDTPKPEPALFLAEPPRREKLPHRQPHRIVDALSKFELHRCLLRCVRECKGVGDVGPKFDTPVRPRRSCVCVCVFFPFILDIKFVGRTSLGHTGGRSHRISRPPSFCGACLNFSREKDSAIPFPRRP